MPQFSQTSSPRSRTQRDRTSTPRSADPGAARSRPAPPRGGRAARSATASDGGPRPGPVGAGPPRAAERQRADEEGRRRPARPAADRDPLPLHRLRRHRPGRPARPDALVGAVHPARTRHRRRPHRRPRAGGARGQVLHDAGPDRRRAADHQRAAHHRRGLHQVRPGHRRPHRSAERPAALGADRGRAGHLGRRSRASA